MLSNFTQSHHNHAIPSVKLNPSANIITNPYLVTRISGRIKLRKKLGFQPLGLSRLNLGQKLTEQAQRTRNHGNQRHQNSPEESSILPSRTWTPRRSKFLKPDRARRKLEIDSRSREDSRDFWGIGTGIAGGINRRAELGSDLAGTKQNLRESWKNKTKKNTKLFGPKRKRGKVKQE